MIGGDFMKQVRVPISTDAKVLKMDAQTIRLLLQNKMVDFGIAFKKPGSNRYSYVIFSEPFYELTGFRLQESEDAE